MGINQEILEAFADEIRGIEKALKNIVQSLISAKLKAPQLFEEFGQVIDRIYGTAMTLELTEVGEYCRSMKEITYKCSRSDSEKGMEKCMFMMLDCLKYLEAIPRCLNNLEELKKIRYTMHVDVAKAEKLSRSYFFSIKKTSCDNS
ncbi:MAG: hypothetical protein WCG27_00540 [Pseudomonadota bacterium]